MNNVTVDINNLTETEREQLLTLVAKANKGKSKVYIPEYGEKYWYIAPYGKIDNHGYWCDAPVDINSLMIGNRFKTSKEAEFEVERLKIIKELKGDKDNGKV